MQLYEINTQLRHVAEMLEDASIYDEDYIALLYRKFDVLNIERNDKIIGLACYVKELNSEAGDIKDAIDSMLGRRANKLKKAERIQTYLAKSMRESGESLIESALAEVRLYLRRDKSVHIEQGALIPPEYCSPPKPPEPSKTLLKKALDSGVAIHGVSFIFNDRLEIK